jgi:hypothetical protein
MCEVKECEEGKAAEMQPEFDRCNGITNDDEREKCLNNA